VACAALFVSVPLLLNYLGTEKYGLLLTLTSVAAVVASFDLGIGRGLVNLVAEAHGRDDRGSAATHVASAFWLVSGISLALFALAAGAHVLIEWPLLPGVASMAHGYAQLTFLAILLCLLAAMPLNTAGFVQMGYQEPFWNQIWGILATAASLSALLMVVRSDGGLSAIVCAIYGIPLGMAGLNAAILFRRRRSYLRPRLVNVRVRAALQLVRMGFPFFVLQIATAAAEWTDEIVIASLFGLAAVPTYSVPVRMFNVVPLFVGLVVTPLWPAYREAWTRGDTQWVRRALIASVIASLLFSCVGAAFVFAYGSTLLRLWVGASIVPPLALLSGLAAWAIVVSYISSLAMFFQGLNHLRFLATCTAFAGLAAIILKVVVATQLGLPGVIWGRVIAYLLFSAIPLSLEAISMVRMRAVKADLIAIGQGPLLSQGTGRN
jgi:O-antigen/teichoic acid export membrane protein